MWVGGLGREGGKHGFALDFASVVHCMHTRQETSIGKVVPSGQSAWMVRRERVHVLVTVVVTLGTTANKLPQSSSGMMFFSIRIINLWTAPQRVCRCQGSAIPVGSMSSDTLRET